MSRVKKIIVASFVLAVGFGLAWPFRKTADAPAIRSELSAPVGLQSAAEPLVDELQRQPIAAQMASTGRPDSGAFDLENHPSIAGRPTESRPNQKTVEISPVTPDIPPMNSDARPAYDIAPTVAPQTPVWPEEVVHVVKNGDTLEKLAARYLEDEGRALELFDLNRDQLTNPHLLPIGAELRIPIPRRDEID